MMIHIQTLLPLVKWLRMQIICVFQKHSNRTSLLGDIRCFEKQIKIKQCLLCKVCKWGKLQILLQVGWKYTTEGTLQWEMRRWF